MFVIGGDGKNEVVPADITPPVVEGLLQNTSARSIVTNAAQAQLVSCI